MVLDLSSPVAGRRPEELERMAAEFGDLEWRTADVGDPATVRALVGPGDVLMTTVGPFGRFGHVVAEAAASAGAHYIDSTGEVGFVRSLQRYGELAERTGATVLPAFGYDYVPGLLAGALAMQQMPTASRLKIGYFATGSLWKGLSQGTRSTMAEGLTLPTTLWRDGALTDVRTASAVADFTVGGRTRTAFLVSGTEVLFLPRSNPSLTSVEVFNGWFPPLSRMIAWVSAAANRLARHESGRRFVHWAAGLAVGRPGGPDEEERARTRTHVVAHALDDNGVVGAEVHVEGPSIYALTGELLASAAELLAARRARAVGVVGAVEAFGIDGFREVCADVGLVRYCAAASSNESTYRRSTGSADQVRSPNP